MSGMGSKLNRVAVGVGPVIAGFCGDGLPSYHFEIAYTDGTTERIDVRKASGAFDRRAKYAAYAERMRVAAALRISGVAILAHDEASFRGLLAVICRPASAPTSRSDFPRRLTAAPGARHGGIPV